MTPLIALTLKVVGVGFLLLAAVGVVRLVDPFQRMHAATKAGTLGAGFVVLGTLVGQQATDVAVMGALTIVLLLITVPVAGHLLGRAAYMSGTRMEGLVRGNALDGVLTREALPPSERFGGTAQPARRLPVTPPPAVAAEPAPLRTIAPLAEVRMGLIRGEEERTFARAFAIASARGVPLAAHALIDSRVADRAEESAATRTRMRKACAEAMEALQVHMDAVGAELGVRYDEGTPELLLAHDEPGRVLLVVPQDGWFHHGVDPVHADTSWAPDGLLHLPAVHAGPVLYAGTPASGGVLALCDRGEPHLPPLLDWALASRLWPVETVRHIGRPDRARRGRLEEIATRHGADFSPVPDPGASSEGRAALTRDACATIVATLPRPLRTRWYGMPWTERIAPGFRGDILAMERPA